MMPRPAGGSPGARDGAGQWLKGGVGHFLPDRVEGAGVGAGNQEAVTGVDDALGDGGNLFGRLARAEHNLGKTLPRGAVMVDPGEPEVLERRLAQKLKKPVVGLLRCQALRLDVVEQGAEVGAVHGRWEPQSVDLGLSRTVI